MVSRVAAPTRMSARERREQLLDATKRLVAEHGFHAVSIEAVAREAGVSRPIVYGHFHDLGGLLEALIDREGARALAQLASVLPDDFGAGDPADQLLFALRSYLEAVAGDPATWKLVLMPQEGAPKMLHERISRGRTAVVAQLARAMGPGFGPGRESPDPELTARMLSAFADESARLLLTDPSRYTVERLLDHAAWALGLLRSG
jgi:AcrR family transcriptional regulator